VENRRKGESQKAGTRDIYDTGSFHNQGKMKRTRFERGENGKKGSETEGE